MYDTVNIISHTTPYKTLQANGVLTCEDLIAYCARVSNPSNELNTATYDKLVKYLIKHKHWSPLEQVSITLEIICTRDIGRQILRHDFYPQEFSQRYADPLSVHFLGFEISEFRLEDPDNRQNSIEVDPSDPRVQEWIDDQVRVTDFVTEMYRKWREQGLAKEQARKIFPEGLTKSRMHLKATVRDWFFWCIVRLNKATQKEHRMVAEQAIEKLKEICPNIFSDSMLSEHAF